MGVCYPGPVSRHNLVCLLLLWYLVPVWDRLRFATTVAVDALGRHGATHDLALRGSWSEWPGECHGSRSVLSERHWSTKMGVRGHGFVVWVQCANLCRECVC